ncbi:MAG: aminotransferase class I/II-fold pyridoxal phosphate-dependent enzyme [Christensenellales bacterium]
MNYDKYLSEKVKTIKPSGIRKFFDMAATSKDIISLGVGEPDFETPWNARERAIKSIRRGETQYTANSGLLELRKKIAQYQRLRYGLEYDPEKEIVVTVGASEAIDLAFRTLIDPGDEVIIPDPSYVSYAPGVVMAGGVPVGVKCELKDKFALSVDNLKKAVTPKTKAIVLPYPNNPTGAIMTNEELQAIAPVIIENDLMVISDEIYSELTYGLTHTSIASLPGMRERTIVINGFSKAFAMTGWRLGYFCAPEALTKQMLKIHQYVIMCAPTAAQYCALEALESGFKNNFADVAKMREEYDMRRRYLVHELNEIGLETYEPRGAFYVFPKVSRLGMDGEEFASRLIQEQKLAVVPGNAFGQYGSEYVRISYAYSIDSLQKAMVKIKEFVKRYII